ncbi:hypothetical protein KC19_7G037300 [Ceratodon purpureus]|uniref:Protein-serine/threonine kinase n=1 Tax=Ceratodon purpureus TaxID=3225 RepID=A0A8T0H5P0_CERPU|nr:hypothetical protein KC19_7G037300 [Ceratodon purpureus]
MLRSPGTDSQFQTDSVNCFLFIFVTCHAWLFTYYCLLIYNSFLRNNCCAFSALSFTCYLHESLSFIFHSQMQPASILEAFLLSATQTREWTKISFVCCGLQQVRDWYVASFKDLRNFPDIQTIDDEKRFTGLITRVKARHNEVMPTMAMGIQELKEDLGRKVGLNELPEIHDFLDRFYMSRIGIRMLIGQHVALHNTPPNPGYIGLICKNVSPVVVAQNAIDDARSACMRTYGSAPEVHVYGDPNFSFAYVPTHLHQMLFELVKNSLRAVQERFEDATHEPPPIRIVVADGIEDVTIKISDEGGGIPRSGLQKIWTYLYSTAKNPVILGREDHEMPNVMAGYGYGLPISRLYARYFGGDLQVISMEGYGTDAYLHLNRLGNVDEPLA